jgi:hypothetical protein
MNRARLPDAATYFEGQGLKLDGRGEWLKTKCLFHGGSDSMRINVNSGGWVCMACQVKGGDVLAFHMQYYGLDFVAAAKELGAWTPNGNPGHQRPKPFSAKDALGVLRFEALFTAVAACNLAQGVTLTEADRKRLILAASRIELVAREVKP